MLKLKLQHFGHLMWRAESLDSDAGKEWRQEEKGMTENQMVGWHHWPKGHEFEQAPGDGEGQGSLACCSPWGHKGSNMTEWTTAEGEWQLEEEEGMGCFLFASDSWAQPHSSAFSDYSFHLPSSTPTTSSMYALSHTHSIQAAPFSRVGFSSQKHFSKSLGSDNSILFPLSLQSWGWYLLPAVYYFCTNSVLLFLSPFSETRLIYPVQFSRSVVSDSLPPRGLQHARLLCPSPVPKTFSNSIVHWVSDAIQPSHPLLSPFLPALNLSQHQGLYRWVSCLHQVAKILEFQRQHQSFQWTARTDFLEDGLVGSPCSPRDSQESSTPQFKSINSLAFSFLYSPTLASIHDYWKNHSLD